MNNIGLGLLNNLKINAPEASETPFISGDAEQASSEFDGLLSLEALLNNTDQLPLKEQGELLSKLVVELPIESLEGLKEVIVENFQDVINSFPELKEAINSGDIKEFVGSLNEVIGNQDQKQLADIESSLLVNKNNKNVKNINNEKQSKNILPVQLNQTFQKNKGAEVLPTLGLNSFDGQQLNQEASAEKLTSATDDFLNLRGLSNKSLKPGNMEKELFGSPKQALEQTKAQNKILNIATYSQHADEFTDQFIKPNKNGNALELKNISEESFSKVSEFKSEGQLTGLAITSLDNESSTKEQTMNNGESNSELATVKTLNLSKISTNNTTQLISKITDYIQQNAIMNETQIDLTVHHDELGQFKINIQKIAGSNQLDIEIMTGTKEAQAFFAEHEVELIKSLNKSGIKLSGMKISQAIEGKFMASADNSSNMSDNSKQQGEFSSQAQGERFARQDSNSQNGQGRRRELWNKYREQMNHAAA